MANPFSFLLGPLAKPLYKGITSKGFKDFFLGKPEKTQTFSPFNQGQEDLLNQLTGSVGGALPGGIENIMQMLSGSPEAFQAFERPAMRQFQEEIIPSLAEGFGGLGAGSSSGAQQTFARAGERLSENLSAQRAGLQQNAMQNLIELLGLSFPQSRQNVIRPGTSGFLGAVGQGLGQGAGMASSMYGGRKLGLY